MNNILPRLQNWYLSQCDDDWEHAYGLSIETLDNPGWLIKINLSETPLDKKPFDSIEYGTQDDESTNWHHIKIHNNTFIAAGDPKKLDFMLKVFLDWAE